MRNDTYDILDLDNSKTAIMGRGRWIMYYRDGRERRSIYRHDLIHDYDATALTIRAKKEWASWEGVVLP